ncbi:RagB/SusD family nutrient uptake outer membrane protein [Pedobacter psychrodurus]|uniref:RagB/SusD family nutrient uptake outer membrane protein n=1 Tax=Pedobacter psychrodurus TaxID=2530456 RepID=A0A4V2MPJ1_9SPHI|nr:RagB/SusD family nutrient uptake outer membrane protein [Pedobacter psychrodurus]TCD19355.1 RagB/SusD family nutrient uptake outer membrane protein [Pedobacter psychrodurus]
MKTYKKIILSVLLVSPVLFNACTNLDEKIYSQLITDNYYNNKNEVISAVLRPYTHANAWATPSGQDGWWRPSELSGDQLAWPTKGRHGEDGGKWKRLHYHTWLVDDGPLNNAWSLMYGGVGYCNDPIENLEKRNLEQMGITQIEKDGYIAELKLLRAYHYLKLMDLFGNIPIVTQVGTPAKPETRPRAEVFAFIEKEIKDNIDKAPNLSRNMIGRMTKAGGYAMLVELYLNAEVWTGTARWDDCIAAADKLINNEAGGQNGNMELDANITDQFKSTNDLSKEVIFAIAYEFRIANSQPSWTGEFFHFQQDRIYGGSRNGNNGVVMVPGNYTKYNNDDLRKTTWLLQGPQVRFDNGQQALASGGNEYDGQQINFVDEIRRAKVGSTVSNMSEGEESSGVRFNKYKLGNNVAGTVGGLPVAIDLNYNCTDWNLYRLTWVYFAKAEALMRKNGGTANAQAVQLVNDCKKRAFTTATWPANEYTTATLTLDELLNERGREFVFEGFRRDDLIRFGKFHTESWWDHTPSAAFRQIFPIPLIQRTLNENIKQNPGY